MFFQNVFPLKLNCYADDTLLLYPIKSVNDIIYFISSVTIIFNWITNNHLVLNFNKCCIINFFLRSNKLINVQSITIFNHIFYFTTHSKYLGIIFDEHLNFSKQFNKIHNSQRFYIKLFSFLKPIINVYTLNKLFISFILPSLEYCIISYIHFSKVNYTIYCTRFNKILRFTNLNFHIFNADHRLLLITSKFIHNILTNKCPIYLSLSPPTHNYNTRFRTILPHVNKSIYYHSYKYWGISFLSINNISSFNCIFPNLI